MARRLSQGSALERKFDIVWYSLGGDRLVPEYYFHNGRRWRFDRAWLSKRVAFEVEGGIWLPQSRHTSGKGFQGDCYKYNEAILDGWAVFRLTDEMICREYLTNIIQKVESKLWNRKIDSSCLQIQENKKKTTRTGKGKLNIPMEEK